MQRLLTLLACLCLTSPLMGADTFKVTSATVGEGFTNPLGYNLTDLSFSWTLPLLKTGTAQTAYQVVVATAPDKLPNNPDVWDSKKVASDQSVKVPYAGRTLKSRDRMYWMVKVWDEAGKESAWSDVNHFEVGLRSNADWKGKWLSSSFPTALKEYTFIRNAAEGEKIEKRGYVVSRRTVPTRNVAIDYMKPLYIRKEFKPAKEIAHARLYATAKGIYKASINGQTLGDAQWIPGWTEYSKRVQTDTYDVTAFIKPGANAIGAVLGDGWFSGLIGQQREANKKPWFMAQLEIFYKDGTSEIIATDESWKASTGPILFADIFNGEEYDANFEMPGWNTPGFNAAAWQAPETAAIDPAIALDPRRNQPVSEMMELKPVSVNEVSEGVFVFDMGQNMVGWPRFENLPVSKDATVKFRVAEVLEKDGTPHVDNYRWAVAEGTYKPKADGNVTWEPTLAFYGYRYIEISGAKKGEKLKPEHLKGIVLYNDMPTIGGFTSSNKNLNQLQSNIQWSQRGNFFSVPTDCPQRDERLGWTGDAQVFAPTATFNMDVEAFFTKWMYDLSDGQDERGAFPNVAPRVGKPTGSAAWADAGVICPYEIHLAYGNKKILEEHYDAMKAWVGFLQSTAKNYIRTGPSFADWLQPNSRKAAATNNPRATDADRALVSTAYFYRAAEILQKTATILGKKEDAKEFAALAAEIKKAFNAKFVLADGKLLSDCQTAYLLPIAFGLLDAPAVEAARGHLINAIRADDNHLNTGFVGTPLITPVLAQIGEVELAYEILEKETYPSWLFAVLQGATTTWERWDAYSHEKGIRRIRGNSFNHYAYGAVGKWMYSGVAGLNYDEAKPGYKNIIFAPKIGGSLTHASAWHNTPYGKASSSWKRNGDQLEWEILIPANATGTIVFPTQKLGSVTVNGVKVNVKELKNAPSGKHTIRLAL